MDERLRKLRETMSTHRSPLASLTRHDSPETIQPGSSPASLKAARRKPAATIDSNLDPSKDTESDSKEGSSPLAHYSLDAYEKTVNPWASGVYGGELGKAVGEGKVGGGGTVERKAQKVMTKEEGVSDGGLGSGYV
eukprot:92889-Amorphochlora_amoeboformis.AAC.1